MKIERGWHGYFKPRHKGAWWRPVGSTKVLDGYRYTKVADVPKAPWARNWKLSHVLLWESANGPLPIGYRLAFKNGDRTDIRLDNLELVSRADVMNRNSYHQYGKEIASAIQLVGVVSRRINRRERGQEDRRPA